MHIEKCSTKNLLICSELSGEFVISRVDLEELYNILLSFGQPFSVIIKQDQMMIEFANSNEYLWLGGVGYGE